MEPFRQYIVRKNVGGTQFNFVVADEVGQGWYDGDHGKELTRDEALSLPFLVSRAEPMSWAEMEVLREHVALPGSRVIECGSHHGLTTVLLAGWVGAKGFVHAFDAVHENVTAAKATLALNGIQNAAVYCAAIGGKFCLMRMHNQSNVVLTETTEGSAQSTVMVRLSSLFDAPPDALKIDVEGAELGIVEADRDFVARVPRLAIEVHTDMLPADGFRRIVQALGSRRLMVLRNEKDLAPYAGEDVTERVHLFSW